MVCPFLSMTYRHWLSVIVLPAWLSAAMAGHATNTFVYRDGTHFLLGQQRFYYLGANCFYLPYFAQDTSVATNGVTCAR